MQELGRDRTVLEDSVDLPPRKTKGWVLEIRIPLEDGEQLEFEFTTADGVAFNVHSHHGKEVRYLAETEAREASGSVTAPGTYDHYAMWENTTDAPVPLRYRLRRH